MAKNDRIDRRRQQARDLPRNVQPGNPGNRRDTPIPVELDEKQRAALYALLGNIQTVAESLRTAPLDGPDMTAQHASLAAIEAAPLPVALAFVQQLGTIRGAEAHDAIEVAQAVGELDTRREVAHEARRARLRLRSAGALPSLSFARVSGKGGRSPDLQQTPIDRPSPQPLPGPSAALPHLAAAYVSEAREQGEVLLVLGWQEGQDPNYLRGQTYLLDFWEGGVKGFTLMDPMTRPHFEREVRKLSDGERGEDTVKMLPISWGAARRLVLEALDINIWRRSSPDGDFTRYRSQIDSRLLEYPSTEELRSQVEIEDERFAREGDRPYLTTKMEPEEVVVNWLGAWTFGDYGLAYDLLADDHPLRRQQTRSEYVDLRRQWASVAEPAGLRVTLVRRQEKRASALWVPGAPGRTSATQPQELEAFWSVVLQEVESGGEVSELPLATLSSKSSARHWYWTGYTMVHDSSSGRWYIGRSRDEGANSQTLTVDELQQRIQEAHQQVEKITAAEAPEPASEAAAEALRSITGALTSSLHYSDALTVKLPLDESVYRSAITDARTLGNHERAAALIERMRGRFADESRLHFEQGIEEYLVAEQYGRQGVAQAEAAWLDRAVATLAEVVAKEPTAEHLQGLGELLSRQGHFNQAETHLREAASKDPARALVFSDLADTLMGRITGENLDDPVALTPEQKQEIAAEALAALGTASKLDRHIPGLYTRMGAIYDLLHQPDDALIALEEAIRLDPADADAHYTLGAMLMDRNRHEDAVSHFVTAVQLAPLALQARLSLAAAYGVLGQRADALRELDAIDRIQPGLPQVAELRSRLAELRKPS